MYTKIITLAWGFVNHYANSQGFWAWTAPKSKKPEGSKPFRLKLFSYTLYNQRTADQTSR